MYQLVLSLIIGAGHIVLIFGSYEIIERNWLSHLDHETLRVLHRIRGIFTALVVGVTVGWVVIRSSPALLAATAVEETLDPRQMKEERIRLYAHWFIAMRWIAILVAALLIFLAVQVFNLLPQRVWWPLMGTVGALAAVNTLYTFWVSRLKKARGLLILQGYVDLMILTVLLHFAGGIENPLAILMLFHVIIGGILISQAECYRMAAAGSLLFALLAAGTATNLIPHHSLELSPYSQNGVTSAATVPFFIATSVGLHTVILFLTAYFVTTLAERLRRNEIRLAALAESALAEHHLLEQSLETTNAGLRVLTPDLVPCWSNDHWKKWFGTKSACGASCTCSYPTRHCASAAESLRSGGIVVKEITRSAEGSSGRDKTYPAAAEQIFQITSAPIHDAQGAVSRVVQLAQDITAQKQAHARMMRAGQMAAVGELAGQVAHEVNNPIAIISAKANILLTDRREEMSDKIAKELEKITDLSTRVARIAQGLLSYCRPSPATHKPIDVRLSIRKSLAMVEQRASRNGIRIQDTLPGQPITITGNSGELEQVFLNLFLNAIHAMPTAGRLSVSMLQPAGDTPGADPTIGIAVDDTGAGVPAKIRERIFEPFFTTRKEDHGTGLGLSICQGLIRSHKGDVTVEEAPGGGARFIVRLPLERFPAQRIAKVES